LERFQEVGLTISPKKSSFGVAEIKIVGQMCGWYGRKPCPTSVKGIVDLGPCRNVSEVRRFLGACGFYRIWIENYAGIAEPLFKLLRKDNEFFWTSECQSATEEAKVMFERYGVKLRLSTAYNPESNGKVERGHRPIVSALSKSCVTRKNMWPQLLPIALWADRTTHSSVTGYMPFELVMGMKPVFPTDLEVVTWALIPWRENLSRDELLELRIRQFERRKEDLEVALERLKKARMKNKVRFDLKHTIRKESISPRDWVVV
jgi:hypothetical protein